jgi:hypothetical protein
MLSNKASKQLRLQLQLPLVLHRTQINLMALVTAVSADRYRR